VNGQFYQLVDAMILSAAIALSLQHLLA